MARQRPTDPYDGRVFVITGGARGIGLTTAKTLARRGAKVAIGDLDGGLAKSEADALPHAFGAELDVTDRASFTQFLDQVENTLGAIDVLVNNAGIMPLGPLADESDDLTRRIVDVNLHGVILGVKLAVPRLVGRGGGQIINVSSAVGRVALAGAATYSATKYGLIGLTEAVRSELRGTGVEVSVVVPMIVNTELGAGLSTVRGQRTVESQDVADAIVKTVAKPRFEVWVPKSGQRLYRLMSLLPKGWADGLSKKVGASDVLAKPDQAARRAYEERVRGSRP